MRWSVFTSFGSAGGGAAGAAAAAGAGAGAVWARDGVAAASASTRASERIIFVSLERQIAEPVLFGADGLARRDGELPGGGFQHAVELIRIADQPRQTLAMGAVDAVAALVVIQPPREVAQPRLDLGRDRRRQRRVARGLGEAQHQAGLHPALDADQAGVG